MQELVERNEKEQLEYIELFLKKGAGSIYHAVSEILGIPFHKVIMKATGISYSRFLREYKWSLEAAPNLLDNILEKATQVYEAYDKDVLSIQVTKGKQFIVEIIGFGEKYAKENSIIVKPPLRLTGYQAIFGHSIQEYTDSNGEKFYVVFDGEQTPPWKLIVDKARAETIVQRIKNSIREEVRRILEHIDPPFIVEPGGYITVYGVTVKDKTFAYHHTRKHPKIRIDLVTSLSKDILVLGESEWRYIWHIYPKIGASYLVYYFTYPKNTL